jgi:hypothetical protein
MKGLGKWPLAIDEYYTVISSENILKYGLPKWDLGGYYMRSLITNYLTAGLFLTGLKVEFASRLIPVFSNMLAIIPLYLLTKRISNKFIATILVVVFCFSVWEIEFARFARMYALFQAVFLLYMYFLYDFVMEKNHKSQKWLFIISFISIFVHEGGIFLVLLNFLPLFWNKKIVIPHLIISLVILIASFYYLTFDFWNLNVYNSLPFGYPTGYEDGISPHGLIKKPIFLLQTIPGYGIWQYLIIIPIVFTVFCFYKIIKTPQENLLSIFILFVLIIASILNLLGLLLILAICFFLVDWLKLDYIKHKEFKYFLISVFIFFIFWVSYSLTTNVLYLLYPDFTKTGLINLLKRTFRLLFNYPDIFYIIQKYYMAIPVFTLFALGTLSYGLFYSIKKNLQFLNQRLLFLTIILCSLMVMLISTNYNDTRYTFFLFPIVLMLILISVNTLIDSIIKKGLKSKIIFIFTILIFLFVSEDFSFYHILNIDKREVNFRTIYNEDREAHYFWRSDVEAVAKIINKEAKEDDIIIVNDGNIAYYLKRTDYFLEDYRTYEFDGVSIEKGVRERWTSLPLIYKISDFIKIREESKSTVWLAVREKAIVKDYSFYKNPQSYLYYNKDGLLLYRFNKE